MLGYRVWKPFLLKFGRCVLKAEGKLATYVCQSNLLGGLAQARSIVSVLDFVTVICTLYPGNFICGESFQIMAEPWDKVSLKSCLCQRK